MATSGVRVLAYAKFTRRDRFIIAAALCFGFGNLLVPEIFTHLFDGVNNPSSGLRGLLDAIQIVLTTPRECRSLSSSIIDQPLFIVLLAGLVAMTLNLILPQDEEPAEERYDVEHVLDNAETGSIHKRERSDA